ncbi:MAG: signal peptide peptidase SppA [Alphaproteobacteria bacterium]|nr:signal peptide peptidase SppA [Alphaproteobacteria bacterium]
MKRLIVGILASIGGMVLFSVIGIFVIAKMNQGQHKEIQARSVLYLQFSGRIAENTDASGLNSLFSLPAHSLYNIVHAIDMASKDPRVIGIVARLDQASLGLAQTQEIRNAIMRFRVSGRDQEKFTIAHADTFGEMSPGTIPYYLASAFEEIWIQPMGAICMTGLYAEMPFAKQALDSIGVQSRIGKREEYKSALDMYTESAMTKASKESTQALLNSLMNQIVRDVALSRELNEPDVWDSIHKGPLFGSDPLKLGMVDRVDYFDEVTPYIRDKIKNEFSFVNYQDYLAANPLPAVKAGTQKIAIIFGNGAIMRSQPMNVPFNNDSMNPAHIKKAFEDAVADEDVAAIVFRVNSPGGSPVASETILRALRKAKQSGKPVIISMSDVAASGGYWISAYADSIVAHPSTITGSIGVLGGKWVTKEAWEKLGIHWDQVQIGDNASMWSNIVDYTPQGWERLQSSLDNIYQNFIERVAEGRKLPQEHVQEIAKGRVWSGEDALKFGLVDKLGDLHEAIAVAKDMTSLSDQTVPLQIFPRPLSVTEQLEKFILGHTDENEIEVSQNDLSSSLGAIGSLLNLIYTQVRGIFHPHDETIMSPIKDIKG